LFRLEEQISGLSHQEPSFPARIVPAGNARRSVTPVKTESRGPDHAELGRYVFGLVIALIAGILGFGGIAGTSVEIAKTIFFIAVILFLVSAIVGLARGRTRV
jgi:uncharacterized membrane protein YtjA (UPF0391 family)